MANMNFVQKSNLFSFSATRCLRNEYFHNDCRLCIDVCPKNAIGLVRNKLTLFKDECVECAGCIGSCPSEAYEIESFDPNEFAASVVNRNAREVVSCKTITPCLGVFDVEHWLVMGLRGRENIVCDLSHCEGCSLNSSGVLKHTIETKINQANDFFISVESALRIETIDVKEEQTERRALFRKGFEKAKEVISEENIVQKSMTASHHALAGMVVPLKRVLLKNSLKEHISEWKTTEFSSGNGLFFNKQIDFQACTNCGDCTQFCPTDALFPTSDKQGIYFSQGKCIGCGICEDICKPNAITAKEGYDLVNIAYERSEQLVHYEMVMCHECRCPFPYKGGDPICDRCEGYKKQYSTMFTLAKDL